MPRKKKEVIYASPELEKTLVQNLVELQKINTDLAVKFDILSKQIQNLLALFERAAHNFARAPENKVSEKDRDFLEKIDKLIEQNKTIAKGLILMEERVRERVQNSGSTQQKPKEKEEDAEELQSASQVSKPLPRF